MIFHLPLVVAMSMFIAQSHFGLTYKLRATVICALVYSYLFLTFFVTHDFAVIYLMFFIMFWTVSFATFLQRNSWKRVSKQTT